MGQNDPIERDKHMKLYHFTKIENLFGIAALGLKPHVPECGHMTFGKPVVWLTTQETMTPKQADLDHIARVAGSENAKRFAEHGSMILWDGSVVTRLEVTISTPNKKLVHYHKWLGTTPAGRDLLGIFPPSAKKHWFLYFGTIRPARIDLPVTPEVMLPGIEANIASAIEEADVERMVSLTALRDQVKALPPDQQLNLVVSG